MMKHILISEGAKAKLLQIKGAVMLRTESETVSYSDIIVALADVAGNAEVVEWLLKGIVAEKREDIIRRVEEGIKEGVKQDVI